MDANIFEGKWRELKGAVKEKWGKLTEDDLKEIDGKRESLLGKLQTQYGYAKDKAETELSTFEKAFHSNKSEY